MTLVGVACRLWRSALQLLAMLITGWASLTSALAGAWMQEPGHGLVIFAGAASESTRGFSTAGRPAPASKLTKAEATAYVEAGVADGWTAFGQTTVQDKRLESPRASYRGFDYTEIGIRRRAWSDGPFVVSLQGSVRLPGATEGARNPATAGNTGPEIDTRLVGGASFTLAGYDGFAEASAGFRTRGGAPPNETRIDLAVGVRARPSVLVLFQSFNKISDGPGRSGFLAYREHKLQSSIVWDVTPAWSLQVGALTTVAGRNTPQEVGGLVAVWRRF